MSWLSMADTQRIVERLGRPSRLMRAFALSKFADRAIYSAGFVPAAEWEAAVILADAGSRLLNELHDAGVSYDPATERVALFGLFYYHDLLVDHDKSDLVGILRLLNDCHQRGDTRWPYVFGNHLYHRFNDSSDCQMTKTLEPDAVDRLLRDTSQGVFQAGGILSGPLGLLECEEPRYFPPVSELPLWHCSDPGCKARHVVKLERHRDGIEDARSHYWRYLRDHYGPRSEWDKPLTDLHRREEWQHGRPFMDLPAVIADCIVGGERDALCRRAFRSPYSDSLRSVLSDTGRDEGTPEAITASLSPEEQHQLLLLLPDTEIVKMVDELVRDGGISIPPAELRDAKTYRDRWYASDSLCSLSSLGLRSTNYPAVVELAVRTWRTYERLGISDDLEWKVREFKQPNVQHSVVSFIQKKGPAETVRNLVLSSRQVSQAMSDELAFTLDMNEDEAQCCDRFLWKLGFSPPRFEDDYRILRERVGAFREEAENLPSSLTENEHFRMRSIGVNLFVSVESFLEDIVCYNVWLMASDHFVSTNFSYTRQDAMATVPLVLGSEVTSGDASFSWSVTGANSIGCLMAYLQAYRTWLQGRDADSEASVQRSQRDFPFYAADQMFAFPYVHTEMWADVPQRVLEKYRTAISEVYVHAARANLMEVRNGLDHKPDDGRFPSRDRMLECVDFLQQAFELADANRLIPKLFWAHEERRDFSGNECSVFVDYRGQTVSLWEPPFVRPMPQVKFGVPCLIAPFDLLHRPNSALVFLIAPWTPYRKYWSQYPRRRVIDATETAEDERLAHDGAEAAACEQVSLE